MSNNRFTAFVLCVAVLTLLFVSCGDAGKGKYDFTDNDTANNTPGTVGGNVADSEASVKTHVLTDIDEYNIVRGDTGSDIEKDALVTLRTTIMKNLGITLAATTDWTDNTQVEQGKEILVGKTNRKESVSAMVGLGLNDYVIKMVGSKLVIVGGSDTATKAAVDFAVAHFIDIYAATFSVPDGDGYLHKQEYLFDELTIDGTDIGEYTLYCTNAEKDITSVQKNISENVAGISLRIDTEMRRGTKYIIFDDSCLIASRYGVTLEDSGTLYVYGSYDTFDKVIEYFNGDYFKALAGKSEKYNITSTDNVVKEDGKKAVYSKKALMAVLEDVYNDKDKIIVGEQLGGSQSLPAYTLEKFKENNGTYPAMLGIDLACYGLQLPEMCASDWSRTICELVDYASKGGIITASSHFANPTGNWTVNGKCRGLLGGEDKWSELMTEGSDLNKVFKEELATDAKFLKALGDNGVPVLWRPLHETNGGWFWFCAIQDKTVISEKTMKKLWIYIYQYFEELGIDNLYWVYSPNVSNSSTNPLPVLYCYPGDDYVDIVGCDWYTQGGDEINGDGRSYATLIEETRKIGAITEFGPNESIRGATKSEQIKIFNSLDLLKKLKKFRDDGYKYTYLLTWCGTSSIGWMGKGEEFFADDMILDLDDVAEMFKKVQ